MAIKAVPSMWFSGYCLEISNNEIAEGDMEAAVLEPFKRTDAEVGVRNSSSIRKRMIYSVYLAQL